MAAKPLPSKSELEKLYIYYPETGLFYHRIGKFPGRQAMTTVHKLGYRYGNYKGQKLYAHRVAWKMSTGQEPDYIDHIDHNPGNNRLVNIRSVSQSQNCKNRSLCSRNKSGVIGVSWSDRYQKWEAQLGGIKRAHLGRYENFQEAVAVRRQAEIKHGFHHNHGKRN